jgi:hypothetical protein
MASFTKPYPWCRDFKIRMVLMSRVKSERKNQKDTGNQWVTSILSIPKFALPLIPNSMRISESEH